MIVKKKHSKINKKTLLITLIAVVALGAAAFVYTASRNSTPPQQTAGQTSRINYAPATKEDQARADANKERIVKDEQSAAAPPATSVKRTVTPGITYADIYKVDVEVGGFVSDIIEDGGTCTATFTQGTQKFSRSSTGVRDARSVACPVITAKLSDFPSKGTWTVVLSYNSSAAEGTSTSKTVEIE